MGIPIKKYCPYLRNLTLDKKASAVKERAPNTEILTEEMNFGMIKKDDGLLA